MAEGAAAAAATCTAASGRGVCSKALVGGGLAVIEAAICSAQHTLLRDKALEDGQALDGAVGGRRIRVCGIQKEGGGGGSRGWLAQEAQRGAKTRRAWSGQGWGRVWHVHSR